MLRHDLVRRSGIFPAYVLVLSGLANLLGAATVEGAGGLTATVLDDGSFAIYAPRPGWRFEGSLGSPPFNPAEAAGEDGVGPYREIAFDYAPGGARHASIRCYLHRRAVLFTLRYDGAAANAAPFPVFSGYPSYLHRLAFSGAFALPVFGGADKDSPWIFFDSRAAAFILSPASDFMVANTSLGPKGEIIAGIAPQIATLPAGFTHQTLLVVEDGVNAAFDTWGRTLTALKGKTRPPNDADPTLLSLGYWTDNGAPYYYRTEPNYTYEETFTALRDEYAARALPLGYLQLDSWFYPKGPDADWRDLSGGIYNYVGAPALFSPTLRDFQRRLNLPLVAHGRWIDPASPYGSRYRFSGSVVVDRAFWDEVARYLDDAGIRVYEQDWLGDRAHAEFNLNDPKAFLSNMAAALAARGVNMQYSMAAPRHFLESTKYDNVTSIRVSQDRFDRSRWTNFLYSSRLAGALGVWPFTDNFRSAELDNLLLATLSAGPVGVSDRLGSVHAENLARAVRPDGVIVKPDVPLVPLDEMYPGDAVDPGRPMIAYTYSDRGGAQAYYVFAYARSGGQAAEFSLASLGLYGPAMVYNYFTGAGRIAGPGDTISEPLEDGRAYYIVAPVNARGIALLGDRGQFATLGAKRIAAVEDTGAGLHVTVLFAPGERSRTIFGYSRRPPRVAAENGAVGETDYQAPTGLFSAAVSPGEDGTAAIHIAGGRSTCKGAAAGEPCEGVPRLPGPHPTW